MVPKLEMWTRWRCEISRFRLNLRQLIGFQRRQRIGSSHTLYRRLDVDKASFRRADIFVKSMLHRQLLILRSFTGMLFGVSITPDALNAALSRQDLVNVVERMHTNDPAFVGGMNVV